MNIGRMVVLRGMAMQVNDSKRELAKTQKVTFFANSSHFISFLVL